MTGKKLADELRKLGVNGRDLVHHFPSVLVIRERLGDALREVELLRKLMKIAEKAEMYKRCDERAKKA